MRIADRIAYVNHDVDDALRAGDDLPATTCLTGPISVLGEQMSVQDRHAGTGHDL